MRAPLILFGLATLGKCLDFPALTGPGLVGTVSLELIDYSRIDTLAPTPQPRDLMVSIFYPVQHVRRYSRAPAYPRLYAQYLETTFGLPNGTASSLISQAFAGAYLHPAHNGPQPDIILFSPGRGLSRLDYTATLSNLASLGYIAIGIDHPYDTQFVAYPDGRTAVARGGDIGSPEQAVAATDIRVADARFVLDVLSRNATVARRIPGVHGKLDVRRVALFGHSLGGATAASAMLADGRVACGANLDGSVWGDVVAEGLDKPFLIVAAEGHDRGNDLTWGSFYANLRGFRLGIEVRGTRHLSFDDQAYLYGVLRGMGLVPDLGDLFGTIDGGRILAIESAYLGAFAEYCFEGRGEEQALLEGPSADFPEVVFWTSG